ncbi:transmembrane protein 107 isoform X3 [Choloepus didactylus]|uniref:transmembrane protein 107 isoform X3 n=1 Tax=Choloepus didactylus TaxID=27675 RepID=UPI00189CEC4E|nr:transmembrane protein 107 isoform X3 [Choloepus didactylus]
MGRISGIVPSRFLTLMAHLVVVITLFWSRAGGSALCHPGPLCSGAGRLLLRSFHVQQHPEPHLRSQAIGAHCSASVALSFFIFERWECTTYWYIFVFCSALPAVTEMALFVAVFGLKKKPF